MIDQITGVPISINQPDCLHWKLSKDGAFTTKSTWNAIRNHQQSQPIYRSLWSKLIIPNISVFAWRLIQNWIPVDERLKKKRITLNIWSFRNESKHKGVEFKASTIIRETLIYLQNLHRCGVMKSEHAQGDLFTMNSLNIPLQPRTQLKKAITVHWRKPQEGWYKLNTDGASKGNPGISGAGGILRNHLGRVMFAFLEPLGTNTNTQAELSAMHRGLQICRDKGFRKIWIEIDAKAIITLISSPRQGAWNLQNTLQRIQNILSQMTYRISHIFREGNQAADFLSNRACSEQQLCILQEDGLIGEAISTQRRRRQWYSLIYYSLLVTLHQYPGSESATVLRKVRRESSNIRYARVAFLWLRNRAVSPVVDNCALGL
ncbi:UNVERIFIED_CONTAM: putative ribonuclease H protein [Sesamum calycinum]|uniref:Ribonuclease H protein n=1 Tax=Sesamum calycinum TaxID=2727403 RepID=A0AAW2SUR4_9LAMI